MNEARIGPSKLNWAVTFLFVFFIILNGVPFSEDKMGISLKLHHYFFLIITPFVLWRREFFVPTGYPTVFVLLLSVIATLLSFFYANYSDLARFLYSALTYFLALQLAQNFRYDELVRVFRNVFSLVVFIVIIKNIYYYDQIVSWVSSGARVLVQTVIAGGVNQEATLLAMGAVFFIGTKRFFPYLLLCLVISLLYSSRGGVLMCGFVVFLYCIVQWRNIVGLVVPGLSVLILMLAIFVFHESFFLQNMVDRFMSSVSDGGSGRTGILSLVGYAGVEGLFGYGVMNSIPTLSALAGVETPASNFHNVYVQYALDFGLIGIVAFVGLIGYVLVHTVKKNGSNFFGLFLLAYFFTGLIRYTGYEVFFFLVLACFYTVSVSAPAKGEAA